MKVYIDAGHGGYDYGAIGIDGRLEKKDCQRLADLVVDKLNRQGISTIVNTNVNQTLKEVVTQANTECVNIFISIHRNAFTDKNANGLEVWTCTNAREVTKRNANLVYTKLLNVVGMSPRGVKEADFYVLKYTNAPAMLLEIGFVTNTQDNEKFDKYIYEYSEAIAQGVCEILGVNYIPINYKVQIGTYNNRGEAEKVMNDAKNKGFMEACIV